MLRHLPMLRLLVAEGGYGGPELRGALAKTGCWSVQIVKRSDSAQGSKAIRRRWVVERTFAWSDRGRRMAKDREKLITSAGAWLRIAPIRPVTRLLARP